MIRNEKGISLIYLIIVIGVISISLIGVTIYTVIFKGSIKVTQNNLVYDEYYLRKLIDKGNSYNNYSYDFEYNGEVVSYAKNGNKSWVKGLFNQPNIELYFDEYSQNTTLIFENDKTAYISAIDDYEDELKNINMASTIIETTIDDYDYKYIGKKNIDGYECIGYSVDLTNELLEDSDMKIFKSNSSYKDMKTVLTFWLQEDSGLFVHIDMEAKYNKKVETQKILCNPKKDCVSESQVTVPDLSEYKVIK